jgi:hypothetical protein
MLHLLPPDQKKKVLTEYRKRLAIASCLGVSAVIICGFVFLLPSYMLAYSRYSIVADKKASVDSQLATLSGNSTNDVVKNITDEISALSPLGASENASQVFDSLNALVPTGITIDKMGYTLNADESITLDVGGNATTRDELVSFTQSLSDSGKFTNTDVPLSLLRTDKDIPFTLKLGVVSTSTASTTSS